MARDDAVCDCFEGINGNDSSELAARYKSRQGAERHTAYPVVTGCLEANMWAKAVKHGEQVEGCVGSLPGLFRSLGIPWSDPYAPR